MSNQDRWETAIHEAAHCVTAIALGGECSLLTIHDDASGKAFLDDLSPFDHAVAVAAPVAAAELLADVPPPTTEPALELLDARPSIADLTPRETLEYVAAKYPPSSVPTDAETVAQFCIAGYEDQPKRWAERYHFIHYQAWKIVRYHRDQIIRVATALFRDGILSQSQITELLR